MGDQQAVEASYIAIVGMACRFPGAGDVGAFWNLLVEGREGLRSLSEDELAQAGNRGARGFVPVSGNIDDALCFDAEFFGYSPEEAALLDPQQRVLLEECWHALEDAGMAPTSNGERIGVYAGVAFNTYLLSQLHGAAGASQGLERWRIGIANDKDTATSRVAYKLGLRGPAIGIQTACSTSLVAVHAACQAILDGDCDIALAGGSAIHFPQHQGYVHHPEGIESSDGHCHPFSKDASGTVFSDGVGVVALCRLSDAVARGDRIYAVIRGSAVNNDAGDKVGYTAPGVDGQADVIRTAHAVAGIHPGQMCYVEAHGTGTALGDSIEIKALAQAFSGAQRQAPVAIGAVKGSIGHADVAAGVAGLIKTALSLHHGLIPGTLHAALGRLPIGAESMFVACDGNRPWPPTAEPRIAGVSSFGIGGTNAHVVLQEAPGPGAHRAGAGAVRPEIIPLQAVNAQALQRSTLDALAFLTASTAARPIVAGEMAVAYQSKPRRGALRRSLLTQPATDGRALACEVLDGEACPAGSVWLFPGLGTQFVGMSHPFYRASPQFKAAFDELTDFCNADEASLHRELLLHAPDRLPGTALVDQMGATATAHVALFIHSFALAQHYLRFGVQPRAIVGHGLGELIAAAVAGVFHPRDAMAAVRQRGRLLERTPACAMVAVEVDVDLSTVELPDGVAIACFNGPRLAVLCGSRPALEALLASRSHWGAAWQQGGHPLPSGAPASSPYLEFLGSIEMRPPSWPVLSCATGTWLTAGQACSAAHWADQILLPVRFSQAVAVLDARKSSFLEIGPGDTLIGLLSRQLDGFRPSCAVSSTTRETAGDAGSVWRPLAQLWACGVDIDFRALRGGEAGPRRASVPGYPFERARIEYRGPAASAPGVGGNDERYAIPAGAVHRIAWQPAIRLADAAETAGDWLLAAIGPVPAQLTRSLAAAGGRILVWRHSAVAAFSWTGEGAVFDFADPAHWQQAASMRAGQGALPWQIAYIDAPGGSSRGFDESLACAVGFGRALVNHFGGAADATPPIIHWLSRNLFAANAATVVPERQALSGVARVIAQELPGSRSCLNDIEGGTRDLDGEALSDAILRCLRSAMPGAAFARRALRAGRFWEPELLDITAEVQVAPPPQPPRLRAGGQYLITGGAGGLGRTLAAWLSETFQAEVWVCGRSDPDLIEGWREFQQAHPRIHYVRGDVGDEPLWRRLDSAMPQGLAGIQGVFHCAGLSGRGALFSKDPQATQAVSHPKVAGVKRIAQAFAGVNLDFVLLFSSVNAWFGGVGQSEYAAANAYLDAFSQSAELPWRTVSVLWDSWAETGMAHRLLGDALSSERRRIAIAPDHWLLREHRVDDVGVLPGTASVALMLQALADERRPLQLAGLDWLRPAACKGRGLTLSLREAASDAPVWELHDHDGALCRARVAAKTEDFSGLAQARLLELVEDRGVALPLHRPQRLHVGPRWDCVQEVLCVGNDVYRVTFRVGSLEKDGSQWPWHPAVMDAAMLPLQMRAEGFSVPSSVSQVWAAPDLGRVRAGIVWVREVSSYHVLADIALVDERSRALLWFGGLRFAALQEIRPGEAPGRPRPGHGAMVADGLSTRAALSRLRQVVETCALDSVLVTAGTPGALQRRMDEQAVQWARAWRPAPEGPPSAAETRAVSAQMLSRLVGECLGRDDVRPGDNFFALGGDSLSGLQVINDLLKHGISMSLSDLYESATLEELAGRVQRATQTPLPERRRTPFGLLPQAERLLLPESAVDAFPLSALQRGILFYRARFQGRDLYRDILWADVEGEFDRDLFSQSVSDCVRRHEVLRTEIRDATDREPIQIVHADADAAFAVDALSGRSVGQWVAESGIKTRTPFGRAVHVHILLGASGFNVLLLLDDAFLDGWSATSLLSEMLSRYGSLRDGVALASTPPAMSFHDHVLLERTVTADAQQAGFWRDHLLGCEPRPLVPRPAEPPAPDIRIERMAFAAAASVDAVAASSGVAPKVVLLAAYLRTVAAWCGVQDVVIGLETHTRLEGEGGVDVLGLHLNTLPMRHVFNPNPARKFIAAVAASEASLMAHRHYPLSAIQREWSAPLFDSCFNYTHFRRLHNADLGGGLRLKGYHGEEKTHYPFKLWVDRDAGTQEYRLFIAHDASVIDAVQARRIAELFDRVVMALHESPERCVTTIGVRDADAPKLGGAGAAAGDAGDPASIAALLKGALARHGSRVAVRHGGGEHTYHALEVEAGRTAASLKDAGVGAGGVVAVLLPRSFRWVATVMAVFGCDATVLLLDGRTPVQRMVEMLGDAGARWLVANTAAGQAVSRQGWPGRLLSLDKGPPDRPGNGFAPDPKGLAGQAAYVIFTSGSTGRPKGVVGTQRGLVNRVLWQMEQHPLAPGDVCLMRTSPAFVDVFWEVLGPLCAGATLIVADDDEVKDAARIAGLIERHRVTHLVTVPTLLEEFVLEAGMAPAPWALPLKQVAVSGELLRPSLMRQAASLWPGVTWLNLYGSSEVAADVAALSFDRLEAGWESEASIPVGEPIRQTNLLLLDQFLGKVPAGQVGELYVCGAGLAQGYAGQPGQTAERFIPNPWSTGPHDARMFRTGDLSVEGPHGFVIIGRRDRQVKVRGARVDLNGLESLLARIPGIHRAAVVPAAEGIAAYLECTTGFDASGVWPAMRSALLAHELPARVRIVDAMPLTASGKIDRQALAGEPGRALECAGTPPSGEVQVRLAALWREVLAPASPVFADSRFDELGGHSLLHLQLGRLIERHFGVAVSIAGLFAAPMLRDQASLIEQAGAFAQPARPLEHAPDRAGYPFTPTDLQQAYWVARRTSANQAEGGSHFYQEWLVRDLDTARLGQAWNQLIQRHGMLRAVFDADGMLRILDECSYGLRAHDLRALDPDSRDAVLLGHRKLQVEQPLPPSQWPLFDIQAFVVEDNRTMLCIKLDFLIVDAWSAGILGRELWRLYRDPHAGLPDIDISFRDVQEHARSQRGSASSGAARLYWESRLPSLPCAPQLPRAQGAAPPLIRRRDRVLAPREHQRLSTLATSLGISLSSLLLAAYAAVLQRWSSSKAFTLTLTLFDRPPLHPHVNRIVGDFTTVLLLEVRPAEKPGVLAFAAEIHSRLLRDLDHRQHSGVEVARSLRRRDMALDAMRFVFTSIPQSSDAGAAAFPEGSEQRLRITRTADVWIDNQVVAEGDSIRLHWDSADSLFPEGLVDDMFESYRQLVDSLVSWDVRPGPSGAGSDGLEVALPAAQLARRAAPRLERPEEGDYLDLIRRNCAERASSPAVIATDREITYGELWAQACSLATTLGNAAAGAECIAVHLDAGWRQVVAVLAIQLANLPYVPLSTRWPATRLERVMAEHGIRHVVTDRPSSMAGMPDVGLFEVPAQPLSVPQPRGQAPFPSADPDAVSPMAYVIFTSGSTGSPKGVMMRRSAVHNTLCDLRDRLRMGAADRVLCLSDLAFDLSVFDVFCTLMTGAAAVIPEPSARLDPSAWWSLCQRHGVTIWNSVPALFEMLVDYAKDKGGRIGTLPLRWVMLSGDWIPLHLFPAIRPVAPRARLLGLGGATEAGIWSVSYPVTRVRPEWRSIPYGTPLRNQSCTIVDERGRPCPDEVIGELLIQGESLSEGYWHRPDLTARAFTVDRGTGRRSYRTGDLARYRRDGVIELIGRADTQVKISGHRVECLEVEHVIAACLGVDRAVVLALKRADGAVELHAVVEASPDLGAEDLKARSSAHLPDWMVPRHWHRDIAIPLSDNGKLDRGALQSILLALTDPVP